jgi:hypothetical protein
MPELLQFDVLRVVRGYETGGVAIAVITRDQNFSALAHLRQ